jgi:putative ABC transport system permease protein
LSVDDAMSGIGHDLRFAARMLRKHPGVSVAAIVALSLGIAGATVVFSVVDAMLLRPWPAIPRSGQMVWFFETNGKLDTGREGVPPADYVDWKAQARSFDELATIDGATFNLADSGPPQRIVGNAVSPGFFRMLRVRMHLGAGLPADESDTHVIVLSDRLWRARYGGDAGIVGRDVKLDGVAYKVVGVAPAGFQYPKLAEFWVPAVLSPAERANRQDAYLAVVGRVRDGVTVEQAQAEMTVIAERLATQCPATNRGWTVTLTGIDEMFVGPRRMPLLLLMAAVLLMLAVACANVANLMLARAAERQREIGIRVALGSTPRRIVRQLFTEGLLLGLVAGAVGVLTAAWCLEWFVAALPDMVTEQLPRLRDVQLDGRAVAFAVVAACVVSVAFTLPAALRAARLDVFDSLRSGERAASMSRTRRFVSATLVVVQMAVALTLLVGGIVAVRAYGAVATAPLGFDASDVFIARLTLPASRYDDARAGAFFERLQAALRAAPGVRAVALASDLPLSARGGATDFVVEGQPPASAADAPFSLLSSVSADYFATLGIPVVQGRGFDGHDSAQGEPVVVVSATLARKYFPTGALGHRLVFAGGSSLPGGPAKKVAHRIVGVVGDVKDPPNRGEHGLRVYMPLPQFPTNDVTLAIRSGVDLAAVAGAARAVVRQLDAEQALDRPMALMSSVSEVYAHQRMLVIIFAIVAMFAMLLATVGVYALVGYLVTQRWRELGIRIALGLSPARVVGVVMRDVVRLAAIGLTVGAGGAFAAYRLAASVVADVGGGFLPVLMLPVAALTVTAVVAGYLPARRAATVDPLTVLRSE